MNIINDLGVLLGGSWASGVNLYLTVAALGIADRTGIIDLPGNLDIISNPIIIAVAVIMFLIEFFADKIPYIDSAWDSVHTVIRPLGAAYLVFNASAGSSPEVQLALTLLGGAVAMDSHLTKATARAAINTSPEPFTNILASLSEDSLVLVVLWMAVTHPVISAVLVLSFIVFSVWFLKIMFRFLKKIFTFLFHREDETRSS